jgi:hypothetical protein
MSDAKPLARVTDTLGAGDTFNAAFIHSLLSQSIIQTDSVEQKMKQNTAETDHGVGDNITAHDSKDFTFHHHSSSSPFATFRHESKDIITHHDSGDTTTIQKETMDRVQNESCHDSRDFVVKKESMVQGDGLERIVVQHSSVQKALDFACRVAAFKCTVQGFRGIEQFA